MTIIELKAYEEAQYKKAFMDGTDKAWKQYQNSIKKAVNKFNKEHKEQVDIEALMA